MYPDQASGVRGTLSSGSDPLEFYSPTSDFSVFGLMSCRLQVLQHLFLTSALFWTLELYKDKLAASHWLKHGGGVPLVGIPNPGRWGGKVLRKGLILLYQVVTLLSW